MTKIDDFFRAAFKEFTEACDPLITIKVIERAAEKVGVDPDELLEVALKKMTQGAQIQ